MRLHPSRPEKAPASPGLKPPVRWSQLAPPRPRPRPTQMAVLVPAHPIPRKAQQTAAKLPSQPRRPNPPAPQSRPKKLSRPGQPSQLERPNPPAPQNHPKRLSRLGQPSQPAPVSRLERQNQPSSQWFMMWDAFSPFARKCIPHIYSEHYIIEGRWTVWPSGGRFGQFTWPVDAWRNSPAISLEAMHGNP